ncbi:hypothetical protein BHE74_00004945 [Ensete ventricosum]|nr:hypothetical protein BHE74_00004945 [Ensete ventricosum]
MKGVNVEDENMERKHGAFLGQRLSLVEARVRLFVKEAEEVENAEKLQVPRQGERAEAKELHNTDVNDLLIKIAENEGHRVDAGELNQGTK